MRERLKRNESGLWISTLRANDLPDVFSDELKQKGVAQGKKLAALLNFMEDNLKIKPKEAKDPIPFRLNAVQVVIANVILWSWALLTPCYMVIPKARQMGVTTFFAGFFFARAVVSKNFRSMVVAHVGKTSLEVFTMVRLFEKELPDDFRYALKSKSQGLLEWESGSKLQVGMVGEGGGDSLGRGFTLNGFHGTEVANWADRNDAEQAWASLSPALVKDNELVVGYESTGKGKDAMFWATWDQNREFGFVRIFLPWYMDPTYSLTVEQYTAALVKVDLHAKANLKLTKEERELKAEIASLVPGPGDEWSVHPRELTLGQILWRRISVATEFRGRVDMFDRAYPSTWERAFRSAGDSPFGEGVVNQLYSRCRIGLKGTMNGSHFFPFQSVKKTKWHVEVWEKPEPGATYVVAADPADGTESGDPSAAYVIRYWKGVRRFETVARVHGTIDEDTLAKQAVQLGVAYNNAKVAIEKNRPGCVKAALAAGCKNLYWHQSADPANPKGRAKNPGFHMNQRTRPAVFSLLKQLCRDDQFHSYCQLLPGEVESLESKNGRWVAKKNAHDDCVIASGIGLYVAAHLAGFFRHGAQGVKPRAKPGLPKQDMGGYMAAKRDAAWRKRMGLDTEASQDFLMLG